MVRHFGSAALLSALLSSTSASAQVTTNWADWTLPSSYPLTSVSALDYRGLPTSYGYAAGATGSLVIPGVSPTTVTFTLSGEVTSYSQSNATDWQYVGASPNTVSSVYLSSYVGSSPVGSDYMAQTGYTQPQYKAHSLTFSSPVTDLIFAVRSLGDTGNPSTLKFSQPFQILSQNGLLTASGDSTTGYFLTGSEAAGVIQFLGTMTTLNWVVTDPEVYGVFNIAATSNPYSEYSPDDVTPYIFPSNELPTPFGGSSANITTSTGNLFSALGSSLTTVFDGGTLTNESTETTTKDFSITSAGGTIDAAGHALTFSGVISNDAPGTPGALTIQSSVAGGSVILQGVNTYTGATTIDAGGTLALSGSGSIANSSSVVINGALDISGATSGASLQAISGTGSIALGSKTLTLTQATGAFAGVIDGSGGLTVASGSQTLSGANSYSGTTTIASGAALSIGAGGTTGSIGAGAVVNAGTLTLNRSDAFTFGNAMSGGGALNITGGGTTTLTSPTGALGAITVTGGTTAVFNTGSLNNSSHAEIVALDANLAPQMVFSGTSLTVASGSTLRGAGFVNAPTTIAGTLRPGNSPGTLVFGGSVTQAAGSVLALDIDGTGTSAGAGNYSSVIVNGAGHSYTADGLVQPILRGITGSANNDYSPAIGSVFTVVSATGGVYGSFTGITQPLSGLLPDTQFDSIYNANTFQLVVTPTQLGGLAGLSPNEKTLGDALQAVRPTPGTRMTDAEQAVYAKLYKLPQAGYGPALDQMSPAIYGDALSAQGDAAGMMASTVGDQMSQSRGGSSGSSSKSQKYCLEGDKPAKDPQTCRQLTVWGAGVGQFGRTLATLGDPGYRSENRGLMLGADIEVDNHLRLGVFGGHAAGNVNSSGTASAAELATHAAGVYAALNTQDMYVTALAAYVGGEQTVKRNPLDSAVTGKPKVSGAMASIEVGARVTKDDLAIEPHVGVKALRLRRGFTEETGGTPLAAKVAENTIETALATVGIRGILRGRLDDGATVSATAHIAYGHEFGDQAPKVTAAFTELNTAATVVSSIRGKDAFLGGVTMTISPRQGLELFARFDAEIRKNASNQSLSAGVRFVW